MVPFLQSSQDLRHHQTVLQVLLLGHDFVCVLLATNITFLNLVLVFIWNYFVEFLSTISTHVLFHVLLSLLLVFTARTGGR